jgi:hypothetical protein
MSCTLSSIPLEPTIYKLVYFLKLTLILPSSNSIGPISPFGSDLKENIPSGSVIVAGG